MKSCLRDKKGNQSVKRCRNVSLDLKKNTTLEIIHRSEMTDDYINRVWLTAEDYREIKADFVVTIRRMMKATNEELEETDEYCCRGLESRTKIGSKARSKARRKAIGAVLDEQDIQREEGLEDGDFIASIYEEMTAPSSLEAWNKGLKDQRAMLEILDPEVRMQREEQIMQQPIATKDVALSIPRRGPSITESLVRSDILQSFNLLTAI